MSKITSNAAAVMARAANKKRDSKFYQMMAKKRWDKVKKMVKKLPTGKTFTKHARASIIKKANSR